MWSMQDMFYGQSEPVWILKPEKDDKKNDNKNASSSKAQKEADDSILSTIPYYPYYYPDYVAPSTGKKDDKKGTKDDKKETKVVMKVPVCCGECVESIETALYAMNGVKSVECNVRRERVTVVATSAAPVDILVACRRLFRKSRMWSDDD